MLIPCYITMPIVKYDTLSSGATHVGSYTAQLIGYTVIVKAYGQIC